MATKATDKLSSRQGSANRSSDPSYYIPPPPVLGDNNRQEGSMGFLIGLIIMMFVFVLILPILGFMLMDINTARQECRYERQKMEQIVKQNQKDKE